MEKIQHIGRLFRIAAHALELEVRNSHEALGLTPSQGYVMAYLARRHFSGDEPIYARDVERHFDIRHSSVSGVLQRLEAKGFIAVEPDDSDRRCKKIVLTEKSLSLHERIEEHILATESKIFSGMTAQEQAEFVRLLRQAAVNLGGDPDTPFTPEKEENDP